ncbi:hypothetical protein [Paenibacillus sp.]|jgi:AraC family L-rhamnose operon regulatory protein RhaS|uniref:hypothetical protein n=1 Tax=Paenibacillus sp. TaxID=58172 RepID=UPI00282BC20B|nr:hypothetical protein [Paenibacillus sp.]MDR0269367.1 hypothetical protein [Paenibacillus sp.]
MKLWTEGKMYHQGYRIDMVEASSTTDYQNLWVMETFTERTAGYYGGLPLDPTVVKHAEELMEAIGRNLTEQPDRFWPCRSRSYLMELLFLIRQVYHETDFSPHLGQ